jgi:hypothetical protein
MSSGKEDISTNKLGKKVFVNGKYLIQERVSKMVSYKINELQNKICLKIRNFGLFEKIRG